MYIKAFIASLLFCIILLPTTVLGLEIEDVGYIYGDTANFDEYEKIQATFVTTARLNLRCSPSTDGERITTVNAGSRVEIVAFRDGVWFAVEYDGMQGYMYAEFLRELSDSDLPGQVELLAWSTMSSLIPKHTPLTVIDVRTGLTFQMISFSHGSHADMFTTTTEDTDILRQAFGGRWCWEPRPMLLIIGERTFAASMSGMPHGGGSRGNGMNGHVCMHFLYSRTHNGNTSHERNHQNAVHEAYNTASSW